MDEIFHIRQAQVYCAGDFQTWDPMITTPPGLYIISYILYKLTGSCDIDFLRLANVGTICLIAVQVYGMLQNLEGTPEYSNTTTTKIDGRWNWAHTAINVALFPPLFFFSGLYYTDLQSLLIVLSMVHLSMKYGTRHSQQHPVFLLIQIVIGFLALWFRQTNVFWVAIFPAGLTLADFYKTSHTEPTLLEVSVDSGFSIDDYLHVAYMMPWTALTKVGPLILSLIPYGVISSAFGAFILWNGGVVLGDKSNHVATIHSPQMLYLWPFLLFFSFPVAVPSALGMLHRNVGISTITSRLPRLWLLGGFTGLGLLSVHYNTIVHPFTLADNRHYMFYVFRILRMHGLMKYLATPVYVICAWVSLQAMTTTRRPRQVRRTASGRSSHSEKKEVPMDRLNFIEAKGRIGFAIVWLATTALSLITAPLVEPRYFIIPWVFWRLSLPATQQSSRSLWAETVWYVMINGVTGYMFLYRPFEWLQEPGSKQRFIW
ncbi:hypothetical protein BT63DRAFT_421010 [Microthyrium microscopicum]|uniref:Dol-P-Glc:Glc(2)Man(9)GlcNAc(2)-PP-Dol alpha-1,2-glucosyltransferase n=1 Tax=Microthyrium microscopicum TaxID=703497 RepID=A0A6A6UKL9_9PEZI|nr:hypothetical protein BT63DRAFT_421010 [Microthyrium microscopicum]